MNPNDPIRQALLDAAEEEFFLALAHAPDVPGFSIRYQAWEEKFLRDPIGFSKRTLRPVWKTVLRWAACFLLVVSLSLGTLMAVSPQARAWVVSWVTEWHEDHVTYRFRGEDLPTEALRDWVPTYLPDGYTEVDRTCLTESVIITYRNEATSQEIEFSYEPIMEGMGFNVDNENRSIYDITIQNMSGHLLQSLLPTKPHILVWFDDEYHYGFCLISYEPCDILIQVAESVSFVK